MRKQKQPTARLAVALGAALGLWLSGNSAALAAADPEDFVVENAADLVDLCTAAPDSELYTAAIHMCHGFVSGTAQYAILLSEQSGGSLLCLPDPVPSRNAAIAEFTAWMGGHPELATVPAPEALLRFMTVIFPCN